MFDQVRVQSSTVVFGVCIYVCTCATTLRQL